MGKISMAVKLYAAIEDEAVHFHLLHDRDAERVRQRMVNPDTGEALETDEIHKGYEVEPGTFVLITPEELNGLDPAPSRDIEVGRFVPEGAVDPTWYDRPYYLGPAGKSQDYFALARVLRERGRLGGRVGSCVNVSTTARCGPTASTSPSPPSMRRQRS